MIDLTIDLIFKTLVEGEKNKDKENNVESHSKKRLSKGRA